MAYAHPRSALRELEQGLIDGSYKQVIKDRGGQVEDGTWNSRSFLNWKYYGIHEAPIMATPDNQVCTPLYHTETPQHDEHNDVMISHISTGRYW